MFYPSKEIETLLYFSLTKKTSDKKENTYLVKLFYDESDETEMVIRLLSFGPMIKVIEPLEFKQLIRQRLKKQKAYSI